MARSKRSGFGTVLMATVMVLLALGASVTAGWLLQTGTARQAGRSVRAEDMRRFAEDLLAMATAVLQQHSNRDGGPSLAGTGLPLSTTFRDRLLDPAFPDPAVRYDLSIADLSQAFGPEALRDLDPDARYRVVGDRVQMVIRRPASPSGPGHRDWFRTGELRTEVAVEDREGILPRLVLESTWAYSLSANTVPTPFDRFALVIQQPASLVGDRRDAEIIEFKREMFRIRVRHHDEQVAKLRSARNVLAPVPGLDLSALDRAIERLDRDRPPVQPTRSPASGAGLVGSQALVVFPHDIRDTGLPLGALDIVNGIRTARDRITDREEAMEASDAALSDALSGVGDAATALAAAPLSGTGGLEAALGRVEAAAGDWAARAGETWGAYDQALGVYAEPERLGVEVFDPRTFQAHWETLTPGFWRDKCHFRIRGSTSAELSAALAELASTIRPLNGVVLVENPPGPEAELQLEGFAHGLAGRFTLVVTGDVSLRDFRPCASDSVDPEDRSRAVVLSGGDMRIEGEVQAALHCRGTVRFAGNPVIRGSLYAQAVPPTWEGFAAARLEVLPDEGPTHRFHGRTGIAEYREGHVLVAVSPVPLTRQFRID